MLSSLTHSVLRPLFKVPGAALLVALSGCMLGPYWDEETVAPAPLLAKEPIREVVVSDMYFSRDATSSTMSDNIIIRREAVSLDNISAEMAAHLRREGVPASARVNALPESLEEGQVLLRGIFQSGSYMGNQGWNVLLTVFSASIIGFILPSPVPYHHGDESNFRFELVDRHGNILADENGSMTGYFRDFWFYTGANYGKREQALALEVRPRVAAAVASMVRDAGTDQVARASRAP